MAEQQDLDISPARGTDLSLRAEMAASEFFMRFWPVMLGIAFVAVVAIYGYAQWHSWTTDSQRDTTSAIADVEADLPADIVTLAQAKAGMRPEITIDAAKLSEAAGKISAIASDASGTAAIEGQLKAAELYRIAGDAAKRREALEAAAAQADGVLKYAAVAGLANLDLEQGKVDEGLARFESLRDGPEFLARQATLDLASNLDALGRHEEAAKTYDAYLTKWPNAANAETVRTAKKKAEEGQG